VKHFRHRFDAEWVSRGPMDPTIRPIIRRRSIAPSRRVASRRVAAREARRLARVDRSRSRLARVAFAHALDHDVRAFGRHVVS
jgi:hypothetical protein